MHRHEEEHTTNTGRLAVLALTNSAVVRRGDPAQPVTSEALGAGSGDRLVLFPSDDAVVLDASFAAGLRRPVTLVVPDGNWRQTRRAFRREPLLQPMQRVRLEAGPSSTYHLRRVTRADGISTLEAIARALGVLEGPEIRESLERLFLTVVERVLWSRGRLPLAECHGTIPSRAVLDARTSGHGASPRRTTGAPAVPSVLPTTRP